MNNALKYALLSLSLCVAYVLTPVASLACTDFNAVPVNESYKEDGEAIIALIQDGCDPPPDWLCRESGFCEAPTSKMLGQINNSVLKASRPQVRYLNKNDCNVWDPVRAGGLFDDGAITACDFGQGRGIFSLPEIAANIPVIDQEEVECLGNAVAALGGFISTGTINTANLGLSAEGSVSGNCASGSVGFCGIASLGGSVCTNGTAEINASADEDGPFSRTEEPAFVELQGVANYDYLYNDLNAMTTIYVPAGGVIYFNEEDADGNEQRRSLTIPEDSYITYNDEGEAYVGPNQLSEGYAGNPIEVEEGDNIEIIPQDGIVQVDEQLFIGDTIDGTGRTLSYETANGENVAEGSVAQYEETVTNNNGPERGEEEGTAGAFAPEVENDIDEPETGNPVGTEVDNDG